MRESKLKSTQELENMSLESKTLLTILKDRCAMFEKVRDFFKQRDVLEVDIPILSKSGCQDIHIELMETELTSGTKGYLHSSPEYGMKKLLCKIKHDIYQLCHVFRKNELGSLHRPEFTMIEWYLLNTTLSSLINQTLELIHLFIPFEGFDTLSYEEVFKGFFSLNPFSTSPDELFSLCEAYGFTPTKKDEALSFLWDIAEKSLGLERPCVVIDFPGSDSQLAKTQEKDGNLYAMRFEVYLSGLELANGFDELLDPFEHRKRFELVAEERKLLNKPKLSIDDSFLSLLEMGLPKCVGVAVGFDRLMMLRHNTKNIENVLPLRWEEI